MSSDPTYDTYHIIYTKIKENNLPLNKLYNFPLSTLKKFASIANLPYVNKFKNEHKILLAEMIYNNIKYNEHPELFYKFIENKLNKVLANNL